MALPGAKDISRHFGEESFADELSHLFPQAVYMLDTARSMTPLYASDAFHRLTGLDIEQWRQDPSAFRRLIDPDDEASYLDRQKTVRADGEVSVRYRIRTADGEECLVEDSMRGLADSSGTIRRIAGKLRIVASAEAAREHYLLSLLTGAIEASGNGLGICDAGERLILCNDAFAELCGATARDLSGLAWADVQRRMERHVAAIDGQDVVTDPAAFERLTDMADADAPAALELQLKDGRTFLCNKCRTASGTTIIVRTDITAQKAAEYATRERERHFRLIVERHPLPVWVVELESGAILSESQAAAALVGRSWSHSGSGNVRDYWVDPSGRDAYVARLRAEGEIRDFELQVRRVDGRVIWVLANSYLLELDGREVVISSLVDLTASKQREAEMRRARELLEDAIESLSEGFALYDTEDRLVICNGRYRRFHETIEALLVPGAKWEDLLRAGAERGQYVQARGRVEAYVAERMAARYDETRISEVEQSNGRWFQISHQRTRHGGTAVIRTDITHLKQMEQALRESEERFRSIAEAHPVPVVIVGQEDRVVRYASPATSRLWKREISDIVGSDVRQFYADAEEHARVRGIFFRQGYLDLCEVRHKAADGSVIPVAITSRPLVYDGKPAIVTGILDLTELKNAEAEIAKQREALYQSEKLNAMGALLAGISHELNNPLSVVVGQSLLLQETSEDPRIAERAKRIGNAADRCARIVRTFLAVARQQAPERSEIDLRDAIDGALDLTAYMLRSASIKVSMDFAPDVPRVWGDRDQLAQVIMNVLVNAQQAMLTINGPRKLKIRGRFDRAAGMVRLKIKDSGPGLTAEVRSRVFEPFFTTKPMGSGTGVGLSICRGIVEAHGGQIDVESKPGQGAAFVISLPAIGESAAEKRATAEHGGNRGHRVLVIDDEPEILVLLREVLECDGHTVTTAENGAVALEALMANDFDAILSDVRMPELDGPALFERLGGIRPELRGRIAFITGDTLGPNVRSFLQETSLPCLDKPFSPEDIRHTVRRLMRMPHSESNHP